MELDFTRLDKLAFLESGDPAQGKRPATSPQEPPKEDEKYKTISDVQRPAEGLTESEERLQRKADQNRAENERTVEIYKTYQHNIRTSTQLQAEILKGIKAGESVYNLFLKAAKAISLMTADSVFYRQIEADIKAIYGDGLLEPVPLEAELDAVQERLRRLREAVAREGEPADSVARIMAAIKAHEAKAEQIRELLSRTFESA